MHVCHVVEIKCILVWTILVTVNRAATMVTYDAGLISGLLMCMSRSQNRQGRLYFHFFLRWITNLVTHGKRNIQTLS